MIGKLDRDDVVGGGGVGKEKRKTRFLKISRGTKICILWLTAKAYIQR